uniref:Amino acid transporter transmembrane domain-containing protein n=1 Tax=Fibrocapsa japonica TaxID=94617 RepID=A0A7S2V546_9STRA|mmetsp:Transcript_7806/g.11882  ORF Transcript_7806/g.11882 Transcript_7806/m.11882 type:complete len:505 (+) Transcript_7806:91-1605(+)
MWPFEGLRRTLYAPLENQSLQHTPKPTRFLKYHVNSPGQGISTFAGICITINILMGTGFLVLPRVFYASGLVLGPVILLLVTIFMMQTCKYEAEVMCRAEAVVHHNLDPGDVNSSTASAESDMQIRNHAFSMTEMCEIFGSPALKRLYIFLVAIFLMGTMVGSANVFAVSLSARIPIPFLNGNNVCLDSSECYELYLFYVIVMAVVVIPLSMKDLKEQVGFQVLMTFARFTVLVAMVGTTLYSTATGIQLFAEHDSVDFHPAPMYNLLGASTVFSTAVYAQILNSYVTIIVEPLENKKDLGKVLSSGLICTFLMFGTIGFFVAQRFGSQTSPAANVDWERFTGGGEGATVEGRPLWATVVANFVLIFPVFDTISAFPLNAINLSTNVMAAIYHDRVDKAERDPTICGFFRGTCASVALVAAAFCTKLDVILDYAGSFGILLAMVIPPYLSYVSEKGTREELGVRSAKTVYSSWFSTIPCAIAVGIFGIIMFIYSMVDNTVYYFF